MERTTVAEAGAVHDTWSNLVTNEECFVRQAAEIDKLRDKSVAEALAERESGERERIEAARQEAYKHAIRLLEDDDRHHAAALIQTLTKSSPPPVSEVEGGQRMSLAQRKQTLVTRWEKEPDCHWTHKVCAEVDAAVSDALLEEEKRHIDNIQIISHDRDEAVLVAQRWQAALAAAEERHRLEKEAARIEQLEAEGRYWRGRVAKALEEERSVIVQMMNTAVQEMVDNRNAFTLAFVERLIRDVRQRSKPDALVQTHDPPPGKFDRYFCKPAEQGSDEDRVLLAVGKRQDGSDEFVAHNWPMTVGSLIRGFVCHS